MKNAVMFKNVQKLCETTRGYSEIPAMILSINLRQHLGPSGGTANGWELSYAHLRNLLAMYPQAIIASMIHTSPSDTIHTQK